MHTPLEVLPYDGVFRCLVRSATHRKREYLVDLDAYGGIGKCTCYHFEYRIEPKLSRTPPNERRQQASWMCKHLAAARAVYAYAILDDILRERAEKARKS